jgi:uncharacterized protein DUF5666
VTMKNKGILIGSIAVILAIGVGFFAGMQYQKTSRPFGRIYGTQNGGMMRRFGQNGQNFRPVRGQVLSLGNNTMTVKLPNGNSEIVILSGSTQYMKSVSAAASDVKTGDTILVVGTQNADGSVTATDVQINPPVVRAPAQSQ